GGAGRERPGRGRAQSALAQVGVVGAGVAVAPGEAAGAAGGRVPAGRLLPLGLGGQPPARPAGVRLGLVEADVLDRFLRRDRLDPAEPAPYPPVPVAEPERRGALAALGPPPPPGLAPPARVVVAAGVDERGVRGVVDRAG